MPDTRQIPTIAAADLTEAMRVGDLTLAYQPKIHLVTDEIVGVEALARWRHAVHGPIPPDVFIPLAENSGVINALTEWVVATAARDWAAWRDRGLTMNIAVNVSPKNLDRLEIPDIVAGICHKRAMPCDQITIELTESATLGAIELLDTLTRCRIKGMKLSLDDFGTGYSSLIQLQRLPFSELKIDKSLIIGAATSKDARIIVKAIVDLAHNLGLQAVAEGVETNQVRAMLAKIGCDVAQGYLFARPMPAEALVEWARDYAAPAP